MAGAHAVQVVSALLQHGPEYLHALRQEHGGLAARARVGRRSTQMRGSMNLARCPDPAAYERANYMLMLQSWRSR